LETVQAKPQLPNIRIIMSGGISRCTTRVVHAAGCRIRILHAAHDHPFQLLEPFAPPCVGLLGLCTARVPCTERRTR
jgi:hypothetical protein